MRRAMLACLTASFVVGCLNNSAPVRLQGDPLTIGSLNGRWVGEFWGGAGGRGGSLAFTLQAGSDSLFGDVTMIDPRSQQARATDPMGVHQMQMQSSHSLRMDFAWANGSSIRGTLEPYFESDCACIVTSAFFGEVDGDQITGRFVMRSGGRVLAAGSWEMKRVGASP